MPKLKDVLFGVPCCMPFDTKQSHKFIRHYRDRDIDKALGLASKPEEINTIKFISGIFSGTSGLYGVNDEVVVCDFERSDLPKENIFLEARQNPNWREDYLISCRND